MTSFDPIGIDRIAVYTPAQYLDMTDLARARGVDPAKYVTGIGISQMAVPPASEDVIVLAANAGAEVIRRAGIDPARIGMLIVGTESAEDKAKPTATHVHELLGVGQNCRVYDVVHACAGATYAVLSALDWLRNSRNEYALIIASDIARYGRGTLGEPTQGAGAVAMLLCRNPRLMALEELSTYSRSVWDFWKPLDSKYPVVDGLYSTQCYAEAAQHCFTGQRLSPDAAYLYHTPYPKLVQQIHLRVARLIDPSLDWRRHFDGHVAPSLSVPSRVGNIYTGSLWLALAGLLEQEAALGRFGHDGCVLFSYGSGSGAALLCGTPAPSWQAVAPVGLSSWLDARRRIDVAEYEDLVGIYERADGLVSEVQAARAAGPFRFAGTLDGKRTYTRTGAA